MDKTYNIGLGGFAFTIEENAYQQLKRYLVEIRQHLGVSETTDEVIMDVEYRMAELLKERLGSHREIVISEDVHYLINVMGKPEQYQEEFAEESTYTHTTTHSTRKKLYRDIDDKKLGGVCSGLGHYLGIDAVWVRLIFISLPFLDFLFMGATVTTVVTIYIILWIVMPPAETVSEKLEMRGENINVDTIKGYSHSKRTTNNSFDFEKFLLLMINIFGKFILTIALIILVSLIIAGVLTLIPTFSATHLMSNHNFLFFFLVVNRWAIAITLVLVFIFPLIALSLLCLRGIFSQFKINSKLMYTLWGGFFIGIISAIGLSIYYYQQVREVQYKTEHISLPTMNDTIEIQSISEYQGVQVKSYRYINEIKDKVLFNTENDLLVKPTQDSIPYLEIKYRSRGSDEKDALKNIDNIVYQPKVVGDKVIVNSFFNLKKGSDYKRQSVEMTLYLPQNKYLKTRNVYNLVGVNPISGERTYYGSPNKNLYTMQNEELKCITCEVQYIDADMESMKEHMESMKEEMREAKEELEEAMREVEAATKEADKEAMKEALEDMKQAKKDVEQAKKDMQRFKSNMNNNSDTDPEDVNVSIDESGIEVHVTEDGKKKKIRLNNNFSN